MTQRGKNDPRVSLTGASIKITWGAGFVVVVEIIMIFPGSVTTFWGIPTFFSLILDPFISPCPIMPLASLTTPNVECLPLKIQSDIEIIPF